MIQKVKDLNISRIITSNHTDFQLVSYYLDNEIMIGVIQQTFYTEYSVIRVIQQTFYTEYSVIRVIQQTFYTEYRVIVNFHLDSCGTSNV